MVSLSISDTERDYTPNEKGTSLAMKCPFLLGGCPAGRVFVFEKQVSYKRGELLKQNYMLMLTNCQQDLYHIWSRVVLDGN